MVHRGIGRSRHTNYPGWQLLYESFAILIAILKFLHVHRCNEKAARTVSIPHVQYSTSRQRPGRSAVVLQCLKAGLFQPGYCRASHERRTSIQCGRAPAPVPREPDSEMLWSASADACVSLVLAMSPKLRMPTRRLFRLTTGNRRT
jgi:hypothetical protein